MLAIFKKDLASYIHSFIGWLFVAVLWLFISLYVAGTCFIGLDSNIADVLSVAAIIMLIMIPILCMRSFAEERRTGTDQLILTAPVSIGQVVVGKWLALSAVYTVDVLMLGIYPLIMNLFGDVALIRNYAALLGMWLFGLTEIAVCVFASSLTESPIIAAILGFALLFVSLIMQNITGMISSSGNLLTKVLNTLDLTTRFDAFLNGEISLTAVIYYVTVTALFLFLTTQVIQKRRYTVSRRTLSFGAYSTGLIAVMLAIVIGVNLAANQLPQSLMTIDVSGMNLYTLTDETRQMLASLDEDITIYVMNGEESSDATINKTLRSYEEASSHIQVSYVDPAQNPTFLQQYTDSTSVYVNSLVVVSDKRNKIINYPDCYEQTLDYSTYQYSITGYDAEGQITSAIDYVTRDNMPTVYVLAGHEERALGSNYTQALDKLNVDTKELNLLVNDTVPEDCAALIINAPAADLSSDDADKVIAYLEGGGNLVAVTNFEAADTPNYDRVLAFYGVTASDGIVLDNDAGHYYQVESYLLPTVIYDDVTDAVKSGNDYVFVAYAQALLVDNEDLNSDTRSYSDLLATSSSGYIHSNVDETTTDFSKSAEDESAVYTVGLKAVNNDNENASTAYIFGSLLTFSDNADQMVAGSNAQMFSAIASQFTSDDGASSVSIPVKSYSQSYLTIPTQTAILLSVVCVGLIPIVLIIIGFTVWFVRRRK